MLFIIHKKINENSPEHHKHNSKENRRQASLAVNDIYQVDFLVIKYLDLKNTMPRSFDGKTWIAFLDMSGFKKMMENLSLAEKALNKFYSTISTEVMRSNQYFPFDTYQTGKAAISSIIMSDCAVIFVDNQKVKEDCIRDLHLVLNAIQQINRALINPQKDSQIMTTCAIAYGDFKYVKQSSDIHTENNYFYGQTYLKAFLGSEELRKKPGYCRVFFEFLDIPNDLKNISPFNLLNKVNNHYNYYWMLNSLADVKNFQDKYEKITQEVYKHITTLLFESAIPKNIAE